MKFRSPSFLPALSILLAACAISLSSCKRGGSSGETPAENPPEIAAKLEKSVESAPAPAATPEATPPPVTSNPDAQVIVLCYHRFEGSNLGYLSIPEETFVEQMQMLKDNGVVPISMDDFLQWRAGNKVIPPRAALITIDDGYESSYSVAWPILKKFGYPFTMFIYTQFVNSGGKSVTWTQLGEMRDGGVEIGCHSETHSDLRAKKGRSPEAYQAFLRQEIIQAKRDIENELGIDVRTIAYPYGNYNDEVRQIVKEGGYEAAFTVYGQKLAQRSAYDILGRYAVEFKKPEVFKSAASFEGGTLAADDSAQHASSALITRPRDGSTINDPKPEIEANLAPLGEIDPGSVQMRIGGYGEVQASYDPETKTVSYQIDRPLQPRAYTVLLSATSKGRKIETRWSFTYAEKDAAAE